MAPQHIGARRRCHDGGRAHRHDAKPPHARLHVLVGVPRNDGGRAERLLNSAFSILHSQFCILNSAFSILHSAFCILNSAFCILHSAF
ncbi:MAG: hypothetical protein ACK5C8_12655, partial [Roseiflexaceae bacterium]